ncbi:MAG: AI-2E family transporter [Janthinobacterium lividum]
MLKAWRNTRPSTPPEATSAVEIASFVIAAAGLAAVMFLHLLGGFLGGLLVYHLIHLLAPLLARRLSGQRARLIALALIASIIVGLLTLATIVTIGHFKHEPLVTQMLLDKAMDVVDQARDHLPNWVDDYLPDDTEDVRTVATQWMHDHSGDLQLVGREAARGFTHVLIGMILGAIIAIDSAQRGHRMPLASALVTRSVRIGEAFRRIVFAQVKISVVNTVFTAIFLLGAFPLFHEKLPLSKILVLLTFVFGLLPVIGNLISNALIIIVALSVSLPATITAIVFLVVIHKLEYFLNARIIGGQIEAHAWELLLAMLVMEAAFGLPGVIAAPIYYAYIKRELRAKWLV